MSAHRLQGFEKKVVAQFAVVAALMAICLSALLAPSAAFAKIDGVDYEVEVNATNEDASYNSGASINVTGKGAIGLTSGNGNTATATAGNMTVTDLGASYLKPAVRVIASGEGSVTNLDMKNLEGRGTTYVGVKAHATRGGKLTVKAGDISISAEGGYGSSGGYGLDGSSTDPGSVADLTVGNITAKGNGVNLSANGGTLKLKTGNITGAQRNSLKADGGVITAELGTIELSSHVGLDISGTTATGSKYTVTTGPITSSEKALSLYTYATASNPDKIIVNGDLTSTGSDTNGGGIYASSSPGCIDLTVNGNVTSNYYTISGSLGGMATITGDVISTYGGDNIPAIGDVANKAPLDLLVAGTISSTGPALTNSASNYPNLTLTTWKVASATGVLFQGDTDGTFAKTVNYIVKVEQPKDSDSSKLTLQADGNRAPAKLVAVKADGSTPLDTSRDYEVAHAGDKVYLQLKNAGTCERIAKAYNGQGNERVELPKDEKGFYYVVPQGGGVYLSADIVEHDWAFADFTWTGDAEHGYTAAQANYQCRTDPSHTTSVAADLLDVFIPPFCTTDGCTRFTASLTAEESPDGEAHSESKDANVTPALGHDWGNWTVSTPATCSKAGVETSVCKRDASHKQTRAIPIDKDAHNWGDWQVTKEPTPTAEGVRTRTCKNNASHKQTESIPASGKLLVKMKAKGKKALTISWSTLEGASGFEVYFAPCNHKNKKNICKKVKTIESGKAGKYVVKKLKTKTSHKAFVMAYKVQNGQKVYMDTSLVAHAYTAGGDKKYTNPKAVTSSQKSFTIAKGRTATIKAKVKGTQKGKKLISTGHAPTLRYISSDKDVASVSKAGVITGKKSGACKVYAIAANGARKAFTVKVV